MAAKRFWDNSSGADPNHPDDDDHHHHHHQQQHNDKRLKSKPTFASVIGEVVMVNFLQNFCSALEPMLRKVVNEEVEHGLRGRSLTRTPSLIRIQALQPPPSTLHLQFSGNLSLSIFTGTKILDLHGNPLQILLLDTTTTGCGDQSALFHSSPPMKVEIVVLDGDFPPGERGTWSSEEFEGYIVKERTGKRPLLAGDLVVNLRDGFATVGDIEFTDNSSWIRSRRFRIGARVVQGQGPGPGPDGRIREAISEPFVVKDHRGELYKKHHPPMLHDEVWRLEKIGKDGAFHKKLSSENIRTVQDFLKLSVVDPSKLRKILGVGMSEKMWEVTIKHAKTCVMGNKLYICRGSNHTIIILNPICQVVKAVINGETFPTRDLTNINRAYIENLVRDAYAHWSSLEEIDNALFNDTPLLLTQGGIGEEEYPNNNESMMMIRSSYHHHHHHHHQQQHAAFITDGTMEGSPSSSSILLPTSGSGSGTPNMESINWAGTNTPTLRFNVSDSPLDGDDLTPLRSFFHEN